MPGGIRTVALFISSHKRLNETESTVLYYCRLSLYVDNLFFQINWYLFRQTDQVLIGKVSNPKMLKLQQLLLALLTIWLKTHNSHIIPVMTVVIRRPWAKLQQLLFDLLTVWLKTHYSHIIPVMTVVIRRPWAKLQQLLFDLLTVWLKTHYSHIIPVMTVVIRRP